MTGWWLDAILDQGWGGGGGGGDKTYHFTQGTPASVWTIDHPLGKYPSYVVIDTAGDVVEPIPSYPTLDRLVLTMSAPFSGDAYLN